MKRVKLSGEEWNALDHIADNSKNDWFYEETYRRTTVNVDQLDELIDSAWMDINIGNLTKEELDLCKGVFERAGLYEEWVADLYNQLYPKALTQEKKSKEQEQFEKEKDDFSFKKSGCCKYMAIPEFEVDTNILKGPNGKSVYLWLYPNGISFFEDKKSNEKFIDNILFYGQHPEYKEWVKANLDKIFSCLYKYHTIVNGEYRFHNGLKSIQKLAEGNPIYERQLDRILWWKVTGFNKI